MNPTRSVSIKNFLLAKAQEDLAKLYSLEMECQVNVAQDGGEKIDGEFKGRQWHGFTDGAQTWKSFRIPLNAATEASYEDSEMKFDLNAHVEGVGMTGWNWQKRQSEWVAFDFDSITGHKDAHSRKMNEADLDAVKQAASDIPWVTVRKSAGGKGLHLYVFLMPVPTENHTEHAALARAILGKMSSLTGFDFSTKVDICGGNMWVWHRKSQGNDGLALIKPGGMLQEPPDNWKDHIKVIKGSRKKILPSFFENTDENNLSEEEQFFLELTGQNVKVPLNEEHKKVIKWLEANRTRTWWDSDHWMLVTHTYHLAQCHEELGLRGIFKTISAGTESGNDHNCFLHPLRDGGWAVRRYSLGVAEAETWDQDGRGWTRCYFNRDPDLQTAARANSGIEDPSGGFQFTMAEMAQNTARTLGAQFALPNVLRMRKAKLKEHKDGRLLVEVEGEPTDNIGNEMKGWLNKKGTWTRLFNMRIQNVNEIETASYDELIRHLITESGEDYGWVIRGDIATWRVEPLVHVRTAMKSMNLGSKEVEQILGAAVMRCWTLVNRPFQPEYPGDRTWNRDAAQFRFASSPNSEQLHYPTWMKILKHCGSGLDDAVSHHPWCKANGILNGADYLKVWIASLFREPTQPLPYLFFYSKDQDTGKSIFHEALSLLTTRGYVRADQALINPQGFNGELKNAILCAVEEIDLRKHKDAYNRIKDLVTSLQISIHSKGETPYHTLNTTHWVQTANDANACPIFPGDTRVTMSYVRPLEPHEMIPKKKLIPMLEKEAPDFLAEILSLEIPPTNSRLNVEVIATTEKIEIEGINETLLEQFIKEKMIYVPGHKIKFSDLYDHFSNFITPDDTAYWTKKRFAMDLSQLRQFPKGRVSQDGQIYIGNIMFQIDYELLENKTPLPKLATKTDDQKTSWLAPEEGASNGDKH
jgi:hypothetical protein